MRGRPRRRLLSVPLAGDSLERASARAAGALDGPRVDALRTLTSRAMSGNTVNAALRRAGIDTKSEITGHGFRAAARTILEEKLAFRPEVIELQLAHAVRDPLGRAYNRTTYLEQRTRMMQAWAGFLEGLRLENVISVDFRKGAAR